MLGVEGGNAVSCILRFVTLIQAQVTPGEAAGPGSAIWWQKPLEEPAR